MIQDKKNLNKKQFTVILQTHTHSKQTLTLNASEPITNLLSLTDLLHIKTEIKQIPTCCIFVFKDDKVFAKEKTEVAPSPFPPDSYGLGSAVMLFHIPVGVSLQKPFGRSTSVFSGSQVVGRFLIIVLHCDNTDKVERCLHSSHLWGNVRIPFALTGCLRKTIENSPSQSLESRLFGFQCGQRI